ncbi:40S ribosomal S19-1 [Chlorella sorokiniana]|uniref:Small ribosomal subunit protein eS19 n=1 Tax=Chlorella sorokiniana TaxID=3076 RepID=A0A2P6TZE4_CHLSO|nr:40S ribosomal S19-1 [Chlorella sorokiniana]|eukprot:PRW59438.1 40S ribosomal S19-1 [Chlorella sorokiniana]
MADDRPKSVKDVPADKFIEAFAAYLKQTNKVQLPQYVDYVKTGAFKELSPLDPDWYYTRAAAIARRVYINQGMGVGAFRRAFGGRSNAKGRVTPEHHVKAAGGIIRHAMQQLEAMGLVEKNPAAQGGRRITPEGQRQMDLVAGGVTVARFHYLG